MSARPWVRPALRVALIAALPLLLGGCAALQNTESLFGVITPYRIDIVQGNAITQEQAARVRPGLTRLQVREILGTPLVADPFNAARWDYLFTLRRPGAAPQARHVVVRFDGEVVKSIDAPDLPSEVEFVASISRFKDLRAPKLELTEDERRALPVPARREPPAAAPTGAVREYPPLEPG